MPANTAADEGVGRRAASVIGEIVSAVVRRCGITWVPGLHILDRRGKALAKGEAADRWLRREIDRRLAARG